MSGHDAVVSLHKPVVVNFAEPPGVSGDHYRVGVEVRQGRARLRWCVPMRVDSEAVLPEFNLHGRDIAARDFGGTVWPVLALHAEALGEPLPWHVASLPSSH